MSALLCWNCGENLDDIPRPVSRQASCPKCFNDLHCCRLCIHYDAKASTTCFEDRADTPLQKENANFCEFFAPQSGAFEQKTADKSHVARGDLDALFGGDSADENAPDTPDSDDVQVSEEELARKKLDDLFG